MGSSYHNLIYHVIFSIKERRLLITHDLETRLYSYIAGIAQKNNFIIKEINGDVDHIHILLSLKSDIPISKAIQLIKGGSSKWIHENFENTKSFSWQTGYGAFTVSASQIQNVKKYIQNQKKHHKKIDYIDEYKDFLIKNNIDFIPEYLI